MSHEMILDMGDLSPEQRDVLAFNWQFSNESIDEALQLLREHKTGDECAHPLCSEPEFIDALWQQIRTEPAAALMFAHALLLRVLEWENRSRE